MNEMEKFLAEIAEQLKETNRLLSLIAARQYLPVQKSTIDPAIKPIMIRSVALDGTVREAELS